MADWIKKGAFKLEEKLGLGGVPIGTAFNKITKEQALETLDAAWNDGIMYYDTSPWYGLTKSERVFGEYLREKPRHEFIFSTKIGRLFEKVKQSAVPTTMWQDPESFDFRHDYTADGTKRAIEDSLKRTGLDSIDIIFVHDLSEDQVGDRYPYFLQQAKAGAFKVLSEYRDQGIIKAWGMGVNKIEPILDCLELADPDICLSATQFSIIEHEDAADRLLPAARKAGVQLVSGAGYNSGFLGGKARYNYKEFVPKGFTDKRNRIESIANEHGIDLITAALHFVLAAEEFVSIIPGSANPDQVSDNVRALNTDVPESFWKSLKEQGLIYEGLNMKPVSGISHA